MGANGMNATIHDVHVFPLRRISDERGVVMHMLRADAPHFEGFGEIYFSVVREGAVKAWKRHRLMTQNLAVPVGQIELVIYDDRHGSETHSVLQKVITGTNHYTLVRIPPMLWYGFKGMGPGDTLIANCSSMPHDPSEAENIPADSALVPYSWREGN
jgi:dTDP-4-dehydrorhamnose 3,5-epimerase